MTGLYIIQRIITRPSSSFTKELLQNSGSLFEPDNFHMHQLLSQAKKAVNNNAVFRTGDPG